MPDDKPFYDSLLNPHRHKQPTEIPPPPKKGLLEVLRTPPLIQPRDPGIAKSFSRGFKVGFSRLVTDWAVVREWLGDDDYISRDHFDEFFGIERDEQGNRLHPEFGYDVEWDPDMTWSQAAALREQRVHESVQASSMRHAGIGSKTASVIGELVSSVISPETTAAMVLGGPAITATRIALASKRFANAHRSVRFLAGRNLKNTIARAAIVEAGIGAATSLGIERSIKKELKQDPYTWADLATTVVLDATLGAFGGTIFGAVQKSRVLKSTQKDIQEYFGAGSLEADEAAEIVTKMWNQGESFDDIGQALKDYAKSKSTLDNPVSEKIDSDIPQTEVPETGRFFEKYDEINTGDKPPSNPDQLTIEFNKPQDIDGTQVDFEQPLDNLVYAASKGDEDAISELAEKGLIDLDSDAERKILADMRELYDAFIKAKSPIDSDNLSSAGSTGKIPDERLATELDRRITEHRLMQNPVESRPSTSADIEDGQLRDTVEFLERKGVPEEQIERVKLIYTRHKELSTKASECLDGE